MVRPPGRIALAVDSWSWPTNAQFPISVHNESARKAVEVARGEVLNRRVDALAALVREPQHDHARVSARYVRPDVAETAVQCDQEASVASCTLDHMRVRRALKILVGGGIDIVTGVNKRLSRGRRQILVELDPQALTAGYSSRARSAA